MPARPKCRYSTNIHCQRDSLTHNHTRTDSQNTHNPFYHARSLGGHDITDTCQHLAVIQQSEQSTAVSKNTHTHASAAHILKHIETCSKKPTLHPPHAHTDISGYTTMHNQRQTQQALFPSPFPLFHTLTHTLKSKPVMLWPFVLVNHPVSCFPRLPALTWPLATRLHGQKSLPCHFLSHFGPGCW